MDYEPEKRFDLGPSEMIEVTSLDDKYRKFISPMKDRNPVYEASWAPWYDPMSDPMFTAPSYSYSRTWGR